MSPTSSNRYPASLDQILTAQRDGAAAAYAGNTSEVCPHRPGRSDRETFLMRMWIRGYVHGREQLRQTRTAPPPSTSDSGPENRPAERSEA